MVDAELVERDLRWLDARYGPLPPDAPDAPDAAVCARAAAMGGLSVGDILKLEGGHVRGDAQGVVSLFINGQWAPVEDPDLARRLMDRKVVAGDAGKLFALSQDQLEAFLREQPVQ
jgi:hypothetical protein